MRNQKGITLVSLVTTIILMLILAGVSFSIGLEAYESMNIKTFVAKMITVQEAVDKLCQKYSVNEISSTMGESYGAGTIPEEAKKVLDEVISNSSNLNDWYATVDDNQNNYKYFDINNINNVLGIKNFDTAIWVNPTSRNIIAVTGVKLEDIMYYRQYDLPGGQTLPEPNINVNFTLEYSIKTYDNKAEIILLKDSVETVFSRVKYYKQQEDSAEYGDAVILNNTSKIVLSESGIYKVEVTDNAGNTQSQENIIITIVNKPLLVDGMTPVKFDSSGNMTETTIDDKEWYNYSENVRNWANVRLKDGSVYVWIPRFAYEIDSTNKEVNIQFLKEFSSVGTNGKSLSTSFKVAPAFKDGSRTGFVNGEWNEELTGFWVSKYETIQNSDKPKNASESIQSWRDVTPVFAFDVCRKMEADYKETYFGESVVAASGILTYGVYQTDTNNIDTHLMKNSEWGAVAYLTHSKYGIANKTSKKVDKGLSYYIKEYTDIEYSSNNNYTGIYGLNGSANEMVAAGISFEYTDESGNTQYCFNSENKSTAYATIYSIGTITSDENKIYGDAMKDTSGWNSETESTITELIARGGDYNQVTGTGIFAYYNKNYLAEDSVTFRPVLIVEY